MNFLHYYFNWYQGQVWPNLVSEIVVVGVAWVVGLKRLMKLHRKHQAELKAHITSELTRLTDKGNV